MRTNRRVWSATLVLILIPTLALLVLNPVEAKKKPKPPTPPEWSWEVEIPVCGSDNLCGTEQTTYADTGAEDGVWADVIKEGNQGGVVTRFGFAVFKCEQGELCDGASPYPVTLQNIVFEDSSEGEGPACVFPGNCGSSYELCLECFVNGRHPNADYRYFTFEVTVPGDFEDIVETVDSSGDLTMEIFNTREILIEGDEDYHFVYSQVDLPGDSNGNITVTRLTEDSWEVTVNVVEVVDPRMRFVEGYVGCFKPPNKKGNCPWEYKWPIWAWTSGPLTFQATWTRTTQ